MFKDITGQTFYRLTALSVARKVNGTTYWLCVCECGNQTVMHRSSLISRPNVSCGCLHAEIQRNRLTKHGMANSPEYYAWQAMHQRCANPKNPEFKNYGARGIAVCERWDSAENFLVDMGKRPSAKYSIERIDNDKGYTPENCKWATKTEQSDNRRTTHLVEFQGRVHGITRWAREININPKTLRERIRRNWSIERALTTPARAHH